MKNPVVLSNTWQLKPSENKALTLTAIQLIRMHIDMIRLGVDFELNRIDGFLSIHQRLDDTVHPIHYPAIG
jgi:hypothetical protein